ncbi:MAG: ATP-binding cassette domain-containing protein, partial [Leptolyngbya sp. SIO3F4]|nr:ATP-binding cassette domain-containing protein [Leptolyngbya sp. SIO3F4]
MTQTSPPVNLVSANPAKTELAIRTQQLTKRFDRHTALRDVDLEIESGAVYGLIGPNGAGKTTLIRLLAVAESPIVGDSATAR